VARHRKVDRQLTKTRNYLDDRSFTDIFGKEYLSGLDMGARRKEIYDQSKGRCMLIASPRCRGFADWSDGELDHIVSRGRGGSDDASNLRWCCGPCHRHRHVHTRFGEYKEKSECRS
jgi:5-methylcytosine-specific restriction endonuclease McrA